MNPEKPLISFDYAIKYLLRDKGDYSIVEGFISALLKTQGYKDVKIIALLESESNKEDPKDKRSLADLIVEDEDHNKYIIEIERNVQRSFIHKSCFNTSRLIVDNLAEREDYTDIVKVFHISLLYFKIGKNEGPIYHGKTIIHDIDSGERLHVHIKDPKTNEEFDATEILPEYFFISIPAFNDRVAREIDDWLYVMKNDQVPEKFHSPYMKQVAKKLSILKMSKGERASYSSYLKQIYTDRDEMETAMSIGIEKGREKGLAEGIEKGRIEGMNEGIEKGRFTEKMAIAKTLLDSGMSPEEVARITNLTLSQINNCNE